MASSTSLVRWAHAFKSKDENCPLCQSVHCEDIEREYMDLTRAQTLAACVNIPAQVIEKHCKAFGLHIRRSDNTDKLLQRIINSAIERGVLETMDGDQLLKAIQHRDKQTGRVVDRGSNRPTLIVLGARPGPGGVVTGVLKAKGVAVLTSGEPDAVPVLPPSAEAETVGGPPEEVIESAFEVEPEEPEAK